MDGPLDLFFSPLVLDGMALLHLRPVHNLGTIIVSQLLLQDQVAALARMIFAQIHFVCFIPRMGSSSDCHLCFGCLIMECCNLTALEDHLKATVSPKML